MTQNKKDLLLKDLCGRLFYGVICKSVNFTNPTKLVSIDLDGPIHDVYFCTNDEGSMWNDYDDIKPYLFPFDKISEDMWSEYLATCVGGNASFPTFKSFDWCNEHHIDYRGLIPMGLAIDATGLNIY